MSEHSPLNICMVTADYLPNIGGVASHVYYLSHALIQIGHNVVVVNPVPQVHPARPELIEEDGVVVVRVGYRPSSLRWLTIIRRNRATAVGLSLVRKHLGRLDVIHQHDYRTSSLAVRMTRRGEGWIWTNHSSAFLADFESPRGRALVRALYRPVSGIITVSTEIEEKTRQLGLSAPVNYIPNGVDTARFHPERAVDRSDYGIGQDDFVVVCARRMVPKNGVLYLAQAACQLVDQHPEVPWKFVFVGSRPSSNTQEAYIGQVLRELKTPTAAGAVVDLGNVAPDKMPAIYSLADIVVMPSLMEAVSLSALEAMAMGKPVIASAVGGLPEIVRPNETGILVEPKQPGQLAEALWTLWRDSTVRHDLGRQARALVRKSYSWLRVAQDTVNAYPDHTESSRPS